MIRYVVSCLWVITCLLRVGYAQQVTGRLKGRVLVAETSVPMAGITVFIEGSSLVTETNAQGAYQFTGLKPGAYRLAVLIPDVPAQVLEVQVTPGDNTHDFILEKAQAKILREVVVNAHTDGDITRMRAVEGAGIYEGKKTEVVMVQEVVANLATNNARQLFAKVPGLNIWESDGAGLQLGIGARGLAPNRTANFNVRQNGYDISADALGYPESYYTPPAEAIARIEVVRGAASLQYGTQFGGLLNFKLQAGATDKPVEIVSRQTVGSFGLFNTFNSVGGTKGKVQYYSFLQYKRGHGWRPHGDFDLTTAYGTVTWEATPALRMTGQYTFMRYLAQQPGGLTDAQFDANPRQSIRARNWFRVDWNLLALLADYTLAPHWKLNTRLFGLLGGRDALGNLGRIDRADDNGPRNVFIDNFKNIGAELRMIHHYPVRQDLAAFVLGARLYRGFTRRQQGMGTAGAGADFHYAPDGASSDSDFDFVGDNVAVFAEHIIPITPRLSVTPGVRFEYIVTRADGYYHDTVLRPDPDTGMAVDSVFRVDEARQRHRSFVLAGVGVSYKTHGAMEAYVNFSQNYRAINFNDIRVENPNLVIDPAIHDEKGFNADLGLRGGQDGRYNFDVSVFYLRYNDRIGAVLQVDEATYRIYRYRTNVADSRHLGLEAFGQIVILGSTAQKRAVHLSMFGNLSLTHARYVRAAETAVAGNSVEGVPLMNMKAGMTARWRGIEGTWQHTYVGEQYSDATNASFTASAVEGMIPAYYVMDLNVRYSLRLITLAAGVNNLTNRHYFTRRAAGYPGPGIIPADARNYYLTVGIRL